MFKESVVLSCLFKRGCIFSTLVFIPIYFFSSCLYASFGNENIKDPTASFDEAITYQRQFKDKLALKHFKFAADNGHASSAYEYGLLLESRMSLERIKEEVHLYMYKAANAGNLDAMKWIFKRESIDTKQRELWRGEYYNSVIDLGASDPARAFYLLADYYRTTNNELYEYYLSKAVSFKYPPALLEKIKSIYGEFLDEKIPDDRKDVINSLYEKVVALRYLPGVRAYIKWNEEQGFYQKAFQLKVGLAQEGYLKEISSVAFIYANPPNKYSFISKDYSKAKELLEQYMNVAGTDRFENVYYRVQSVHAKIASECAEIPPLCMN